MALRNSKLTIVEEAAQARQAGKTFFVFLAPIAPGTIFPWGRGQRAAYLPELSADLQAIQSAGWHLQSASWSNAKLVLFVFTS